MASIRSNLNSVPSTYSLSAINKKITTCFHQWRRKTVELRQQYTQHYQQQHYFQHSYKKYSFAGRTSENFKNFNKKFRNFLKSNKNLQTYTKKRFESKEKVEIVAKILSSTLIATATVNYTADFEVEKKEIGNMTITDETFLSVRDEFPDLDKEVRSILMARAQEGATIANIRADYRQNTGLKFPIYNNITEFLLSIPSVVAACNQNGTRMFSVIPTEKTKHMHELISGQKSQTGTTKPYNTNNRRRLQPFYPSAVNNNNKPLQPWRSCKPHQSQWRSTNYPVIPPPQTDQQLYVGADRNVTRSESEGFVEDNFYYQDNCKHLHSRLYNQPNNVPPQIVADQNQNASNNNNNMFINNHNNNNLNAGTQFNNFNNNFGQQLKQQYHQQQQQSHNFNIVDHQKEVPAQLQYRRADSPTRSSQYTDSLYTMDSDYDAHLLDFPLLGDDFFLFLARMELNCKFKKFSKVYKSGLCISGQTIHAATKRIRKLPDSENRIIINIGSVDIMQGRPLVQIEHDFRELINTMHKKGIRPIVTTLAPLANYLHEPTIKDKLERFNRFIKRECLYLVVIDIHSCLINDRKQILFDCFQNAPRTVSGAVHPYVFWNKIGRQRVLQLIESKIEY